MIPNLNISFTSMEKSTKSPLLYCWISRNNPYYNEVPEFFAELVTKCWRPERDVTLVNFIRSNWGEDEWSKGSFLSPGDSCCSFFFFVLFPFLTFISTSLGIGCKGPEDLETLQRPIPPLFFAGSKN